MGQIEDVHELESVVGSPPRAILMKSIERLDDHCRAVVERSTAAVVTYCDDRGRRARLAGGPPGFAWESSTSLAIPAFDDAAAGTPVGACFLTPGWRETLRVNGTFGSRFDVTEALIHCGKAVIRSKLWDPPTDVTSPSRSSTAGVLDDAARAFLAESPFLVVGSCDAEGNADASPKGDPAGFVHVVDDTTIAIPDRKGNKRTDTFHNVLADPRVAVLALAPGDARTLELGGEARISTDPSLLAQMAVQGREPKVALVVELDRVRLEPSDALRAAELWNTEHHIGRDDLPLATRMWTDHIGSNQANGLAAGATKLAARVAKLADRTAAAEAVLKRDYEQNLY